MSPSKMAKTLAPILAAAILAWCATPASAGVLSAGGLGNRSGIDGGYVVKVWFDGRDDVRDGAHVVAGLGAAQHAALAVHLMINTALTGATYDIDGGQQLVAG